METYDNTVGLLVEYVADPIASTKFSFESSTFSITRDAFLSTTNIVTVFTLVSDVVVVSSTRCISKKLLGWSICIFCSIFSIVLLVGLITLTLTLCPIDAASFNNCIIPIRSSRRNELTVGNNNNTSSLADFIKSMNNSLVLDGIWITSVLPDTIPFSISLILRSAGIALFQKLSNTYLCCSTISLTLL